jgi:phosphoglucomutase
VTTNLIADISANYRVACYETLTGFKYIGEVMTNLLGKEQYLVGGEESYGFLVGDLVRDKDAVNACAFIAEMTAYFKNEGKTLFDVLLDLYVKYGYYKEKLISLTRKGKAGADEIKQMMVGLRTDTPTSLGGIRVKELRDYENRIATNLISGEKRKIELPQSDVLQFITVDGDVISVRPSGTEPKIKFYCSVKETLLQKPQYEEISLKLEEKVKNIMADIVKE